MIGESNDVAEAQRLLADSPGEDALRDVAHAAGDAGCPDVLRLVLPHIPWPKNDSRWEWILIQPPRGIEPNGRDHEAAFTCMEILLQHGIDPNVTNGHGQTVLNFVAARPGLTGAERARFAAMLIDAGARLDLRDTLLQSTPLGWACRWGRTEMVQLLLDRGAPSEEPGTAPWATPLVWATKMGHAGIAALLTKNY
jgi:ankyrin repeat protein